MSRELAPAEAGGFTPASTDEPAPAKAGGGAEPAPAQAGATWSSNPAMLRQQPVLLQPGFGLIGRHLVDAPVGGLQPQRLADGDDAFDHADAVGVADRQRHRL